MLTVELADVLKAASTATSVLGLSVLLKNSSGQFVQSCQLMPTPQTPACSDLDTATPGWMRIGPWTTNRPSSIPIGSFVLTLQYDPTAKTQFVFCWATSPKFVARRHSSGTADDKWQDWYELA